jgi:hypothetical protein
MKAVWHELGQFCLVTALCLVAWIGPPALPAKAESCGDVIADGGFETGGVWQLGATPVPPEYVTHTKHTGARSLALGIAQGANAASYSSAKQIVMIPSGASEAKLSFWFYAAVGAQAGADKMQLLLLNPDGTTLAVLWTSSSNNPAWSQLTYDVTPWRGQTVQVYFNVINDGSGDTTGIFLDDVSLAVCPGPVLATATGLTAVSDAPQGSTDPVPTTIPSASTDNAEETPEAAGQTPAMIFFTPESDPAFSQADSRPIATDSEAAATVDPSPGSGTPDLVFFTPTANPALAGADSNAPQLDSGTPGTPAEITRISLPVTPSWTALPRPTRVTIAPRATSGTSAPPAPSEAPFAQWPKGWWFAVGAVFAIILAAGLVARRTG